MQSSDKRSICHFGINALSDSSHVFTSDAEKGFSLIELVAAVTVLGILSSLAIPRIGDIISSTKIDEAKALLNSAAADCLQKSRLNDKNKETIDESIISNQRLSSIGFKIDKANNADKCSYFQLVPLNGDDNIRFPIGFSVTEGILSKFSNPTSTDKGSIKSCERWGGVNCRQDERLKKLVEWKNGIANAKKACETRYSKWLTERNTQPMQYTRWNPNANSGCPTKPPADGSTSYQTDPTCTPNGCNRVVYGLDGKFVGFAREDYDRALEAKYGKACTAWVANKKLANYTNNPQNKPEELKECGSQKFWFYKGIDTGDQDEFNKRICSDNLEIARRTTSGTSLQKTVQGCGSKVYNFCDAKIKDTEKDYKECSCDVDKYNTAQAGKNGSFTTTEKGATGCGNFWICDKEILDDQGSYDNKCKAKTPPKNCLRPTSACDRAKYYTHQICFAYSKCMGRIP